MNTIGDAATFNVPIRHVRYGFFPAVLELSLRAKQLHRF
ncbi:Uncharacterised protein [Vibrio cholerae]|uniref:Uncharacterized protein n=1 Tax=Vibrio cholerae TaxID=666 RepID=A0A655WUU2_VIBCL|nr:Uncharacterised protein [Vibrio cholerae]CSB98562.1 Uncharacterised protein [Vibrio cholerae]